MLSDCSDSLRPHLTAPSDHTRSILLPSSCHLSIFLITLDPTSFNKLLLFSVPLFTFIGVHEYLSLPSWGFGYIQQALYVLRGRTIDPDRHNLFRAFRDLKNLFEIFAAVKMLTVFAWKREPTPFILEILGCKKLQKGLCFDEAWYRLASEHIGWGLG